jgi:hypothetical protein
MGGIVMSKIKNHFELTHPNAAGIDIGASSHFVAVPPGRDEQPVREFLSFTTDSLCIGRLVDCVWRGYGGDGIHRRVLDSSV